MSVKQWAIHKLGGTCLATGKCYRNVVANVLPVADPERIFVVCSAMGSINPASDIAKMMGANNVKTDKVTNTLIKCHTLAAAQDPSFKDEMDKLKARQLATIKDLLNEDVETPEPNKKHVKTLCDHLRKDLTSDFEDLYFILRSTWLGQTLDLNHWSLGYGEVWSCRMMAAYINYIKLTAPPGANTLSPAAVMLDAREVLTLLDHDTTSPNIAKSREQLQKWLAALDDPSSTTSNAKTASDWMQAYSREEKAEPMVVCTGYVATTHDGKPTTLGRDGSDFTASIMGALLNAQSVTIWTDVDGVYSANPAAVKQAVIRSMLSYDEASELAYFGAKVIHPATMTPLVVSDIPLMLRNAFNPKAPGTTIFSRDKMLTAKPKRAKTPLSPSTGKPVPDYGVQGFSCITGLSLITLEGTGMLGVHGVAHRLFGAMFRSGYSVALISQGGSEHSICLAVKEEHTAGSVKSIEREFRDELERGEIKHVSKVEQVACLAVVGEGMKSNPGVAGRTFTALAAAGVNIMAIAQGASELNISAIVRAVDAKKAVLAVHRAFIDEPESPAAKPANYNKPKPPAFSLGEGKVSLEKRKAQLDAQIASLQKEAAEVASKLKSC